MSNQVIPIAQGGVAPLATLGAMPAFMQQAAAQSSMGTFGDSLKAGRLTSSPRMANQWARCKTLTEQ